MSYFVFLTHETFLTTLLTLAAVIFLPKSEVSLKCDLNWRLSIGLDGTLATSVLPKPILAGDGFTNPKNT